MLHTKIIQKCGLPESNDEVQTKWTRGHKFPQGWKTPINSPSLVVPYYYPSLIWSRV
jgi:hypothetical protein